MDKEYVKLDSVQSLNEYLGMRTNHPLLDVINLSDVPEIEHRPKYFGVYGIVCGMAAADSASSGEASAEGGAKRATLSFFSPGQLGRYRSGRSVGHRGWMLVFHEDVFRDTVLERYISLCRFFNSSNRLSLSGAECDVIVNCMLSLRHELLGVHDQHTSNILVSGLSVILCQCMRFFDRQTNSAEEGRVNILSRLDLLLNDYVTSDHSIDRAIPTVAWCAKQLHLSANYFGDLIKQRTGRSAQEYIQHRIINEAKMLLSSGRYTISEIAYRLGFKYPHHLTRMFHRIEGCTPNQYRLRIVK